MDFPFARGHGPVVSSLTLEANYPAAIAPAVPPSSAVWPAADRAILYPFALHSPYLVRKVWWANGSAVAGNVDCGVYTTGGALLLSSGSTAQAGTNVVQSVTLGTPVLLTPGTYYCALACSSTSATILRSAYALTAMSRAIGAAQQASALPLPSTITIAQAATNNIPLCGIARAGVI